MQQIIECVPNFSEGRRAEVYNAIVEAIRQVKGTQLLGVSADPDHNRTVVTFAGDAATVEEAAFRAIQVAAEQINLDEHEGEHPRLGATDVVPFIPVKGATMDDCVEIARRLGRRVGEELGIAVYLYGEAATRPERQKLSAIRKGEYEQWRDEVATDPAREPDFGPAEPKPWGATVIGARPFLIAYNIYLNSDDVDIANRIARAVRASSGGLQNVQGLGFLVEGQAQVSMNLLNFERTPLFRVQELVRREAAHYGLSITKAELVGLTPQKALMDAAKWYLQLDDVEDDQILEYRLASAAEAEEALADTGLAETVPHAFLDALAGGTPTPGGGAVAALAGSLGAALAEMVAGLTVGRKKYADVEEESQEILQKAEQLRHELAQAIVDDAAAFDRLMAAYRNKELSDADRAEAIEQGTIGAGEVPLRVARLSSEVASLAQRVARVGNSNAVTDAAAGGIMARAAAQVAALNVKVNATGLKNRVKAQSWLEEVEALEADATVAAAEAMKIAAVRGGF